MTYTEHWVHISIPFKIAARSKEEAEQTAKEMLFGWFGIKYSDDDMNITSEDTGEIARDLEEEDDPPAYGDSQREDAYIAHQADREEWKHD